MSLYSKWQEKIDSLQGEELSKYLNEYYEKEKNAYAEILKKKEKKIEGNLLELSSRFNLEDFEMIAFIEGISESVKETPLVEDLKGESNISLEIIWEELYKNMHKAKADWLYDLEEWDGIFTEEKRASLLRDFKKSLQAVSLKEAGRNDPCPCGSGKKYKKCCGRL